MKGVSGWVCVEVCEWRYVRGGVCVERCVWRGVGGYWGLRGEAAATHRGPNKFEQLGVGARRIPGKERLGWATHRGPRVLERREA